MSEIYVRVNPRPGVRTHVGRTPNPPIEAFSERASEATEALIAVSQQIKTQLDALAALPDDKQAWAMDRVEVSFDLELEAKVGVIVVNGSTSAAFGVKIGWTRAPGR